MNILAKDLSQILFSVLWKVEKLDSFVYPKNGILWQKQEPNFLFEVIVLHYNLARAVRC